MPGARRRGRGPREVIGPRARGEYLGGSDVKYTWPCGHWRRETVLNGAPGPRGKKPMEPNMVRFLARYWHQGVQVGPCPTCGSPEFFNPRKVT